jgi:hypothetical protein
MRQSHRHDQAMSLPYWLSNSQKNGPAEGLFLPAPDEVCSGWRAHPDHLRGLPPTTMNVLANCIFSSYNRASNLHAQWRSRDTAVAEIPSRRKAALVAAIMGVTGEAADRCVACARDAVREYCLSSVSSGGATGSPCAQSRSEDTDHHLGGGRGGRSGHDVSILQSIRRSPARAEPVDSRA